MAAAPVCSNCGVVEAIQRSQAAGGNSNGYVGAVAGGIIGAIFGNEVGHREGRKFARVLGAIGGALVGREIERAGTQHFRYDVIVRLESGSRQSIAFDAPPPLRVGDKVRLAEGRVQRVG
jgi:outer membrane lipoprotein SlyB